MFVHINCGSVLRFLFSTCRQILRSYLNVLFVVGGYGFEEFVASSHLWEGRVEQIIKLIALPTLLCAEHQKVSVKFFYPLILWAAPQFWEEQLSADSGVRGKLKCDGTRAETRFRLSAKNERSPFKSAGGGGDGSVDYWQPRYAHQR